MSLYSAGKDDFWTLELLGGEADGRQISVPKLQHQHFPPTVWYLAFRTYKMKYLRWADNVFVYELVRG